MKKRHSNIVYSTARGSMCPDCGNPVDDCACGKQRSASGGDGIVRLSRETKGRRGRGVTIISGVPLDPDSLKVLAKELKRKCGSGGTVKNGVIEIQGEHRDMLMDELEKRGYTVKKSGG